MHTLIAVAAALALSQVKCDVSCEVAQSRSSASYANVAPDSQACIAAQCTLATPSLGLDPKRVPRRSTVAPPAFFSLREDAAEDVRNLRSTFGCDRLRPLRLFRMIGNRNTTRVRIAIR